MSTGQETAFEDKLSGAQLLAALKAGGNVIFIRHAATERDFADQVSAVMGDCSTQRTLSEAGWQQARAIGKAFDQLQIPVGEVYSSEYCRAWQTADLAFGHYRKDAGSELRTGRRLQRRADCGDAGAHDAAPRRQAEGSGSTRSWSATTIRSRRQRGFIRSRWASPSSSGPMARVASRSWPTL